MVWSRACCDGGVRFWGGRDPELNTDEWNNLGLPQACFVSISLSDAPLKANVHPKSTAAA